MDGEQRAETSAGGAFQSNDFVLYQIARLLVVLGAEAQSVAVAWHVYQITHSALDLGYTGLALFLPGIFLCFRLGHFADRYDRRKVILGCYTVQAVCSATLLWLGLHRTEHIWPIYACAVRDWRRAGVQRAGGECVACPRWYRRRTSSTRLRGERRSSRSRILPGLRSEACCLRFSFQRCAGGVDGAAGGVCLYAADAVLGFLVLVSMIRPRVEVTEKKAFSVRTMLAGLEYVWSAKLLLGSISLDLFAVLLGGAVALLPIFSQDILHAGPRGLGMLRAMPSIGSSVGFAVSDASADQAPGRGQDADLCVAIFGAATVVFGLSKNLWISVAALIAIGASDMVSVVIRSSILQLATPPQMRGRVSAVNWLFIGASNEFGEFESGVTAHWFGSGAGGGLWRHRIADRYGRFVYRVSQAAPCGSVDGGVAARGGVGAGDRGTG